MGRRSLRITFALQGEGRGHMTQALALAHHLRAAGHVVDQVLVGLGPDWTIPPFFEAGIGAPVIPFRGPTHALDATRSGVSAAGTVWRNLAALPAMLGAARERFRQITPERTDVVVGFYDAVGGLSRAFGHRVPAVVIGHHYVLFHSRSPAPPVSMPAALGLRWLTRLTAHGASEVLALSFRDLGPDPDRPAGRGPWIVPPLLRPELSGIRPRDDGHLLAYAVTPGIGERVVAWQRANPGVEVHLYVAGGRTAVPSGSGARCHVHDLDGRTFLEHMGSCHAYAGSAGFESVCEAHYLGKPVLAVPTAGQIEQHFNAFDGARAGVVRAGTWGDLDDFWRTAAAPDPDALTGFRAWVDGGPARIVEAVERAAA